MIDDVDRSRFEITAKKLVAFAAYRRHDKNYAQLHIEADPALRGTGTAGRLMAAIVAHARANGLTLTPRCGYAAAWFWRHPDAGDVLA